MKSKWYVAHVILYVKFKDGEQDHYPIWENLYLIKASSPKKAWEKADECGRLEERASKGSGLRWAGRPATWVYAGTRKLNECLEDPFEGPFAGKAEVTYSELRVESAKELKKLVKGTPVSITYVK